MQVASEKEVAPKVCEERRKKPVQRCVLDSEQHDLIGHLHTTASESFVK
jgi:hypothetical protein